MTHTTEAAQPAPEWKNLFGVCAAIGEDLGFDPLWLRIGFAVPLIWRPEIVLAAYAAMGLVVLVSRLAYPSRNRQAIVEPLAIAPRATVDGEAVQLARAA